MASEVIELAAKALALHRLRGNLAEQGKALISDEAFEPIWAAIASRASPEAADAYDGYLADARAVVVAMREMVTKEMVIAGETALEDFTDSDYSSDAEGNRFPYDTRRPGWELQVWQSMIDKALEQNKN
jgi:hypothetical protein